VAEKMNSMYETKNNDLKVIIGPGIQKDSLIYDENIFKKITSNWGEYIKRVGENKYSIDNLGYAISQLMGLGISKDNIEIKDIDVAKSNEYFSHSRDFHLGTPDQGRFCIVVKIEKD
jgi:copper oxidase (laccase) domain-containing protein